jgi:hypothetical protein
MRACKELRQIDILISIADFFMHPTLGDMVQFIASRSIHQPDEARKTSPSRLFSPKIAGSELHRWQPNNVESTRH